MIERKLVSKKLETLPPSPTHVMPVVGINLEERHRIRFESPMLQSLGQAGDAQCDGEMHMFNWVLVFFFFQILDGINDVDLEKRNPSCNTPVRDFDDRQVESSPLRDST